jgi:hypothetical protein
MIMDDAALPKREAHAAASYIERARTLRQTRFSFSATADRPVIACSGALAGAAGALQQKISVN